MGNAVGDLVRVLGTFTNDAGTLTDPSVVYFGLKSPNSPDGYVYDSSVPDRQIVRVSTGVYYFNVDLTYPGIYEYAWRCTGANVHVAAEGSIEADETTFPYY